jgi:dTDP-4-dehydrorhamnose reductase
MRLLGEGAISLTRSEVDLAETDTIPKVLADVDPDVIINCAAYTNVDRAESEEDLATLINGTAVEVMADWAESKQRRLLTFSTDYVFGGDATTPYVETSPTDPINAYGRTKLHGEVAALAAGALVVRASWVISGSHPSFVSTILRAAKDGPLRVVDDQWGCPTVSHDLAVTSLEALRTGMTGLLHVTNQGPATWFDLARASLGEAGLDPEAVSPCPTEEYPTPARRPAYSVLASERLRDAGLAPPPPWSQSLPAVIAEIKTWL